MLHNHAVRGFKSAALCFAVLALLGCKDDAGQALDDTSHLYDTMIINAQIVDGTGKPRTKGAVLLKDGVIAKVGDIDPQSVTAGQVIDAQDRVLAPGFIDLHAHGNPLEDSYEGFLAMGVTTVVLGQDGRTAGVRWNSEKGATGAGLAHWLKALKDQGSEVNVVPMSGHGTLRYQAGIGAKAESLTPDEISALRSRLDADMEAGAFGMTTGLEYIPGLLAEPSELVALAQVVGSRDGIIMSHMRTEDDDKIEGAIEELVAQGKEARVHISHLKIVYGKGAERAERLLDYIGSLQAQGIEISADIYPYIAGYTGVAILFPDWALPPHDYETVVKTRRDDLAAYLSARIEKRNGPGALLFGSEPYSGMTLEDVANEAGMDVADFLISIGPDGGSGAHFTQDASTHDVLVASDLTALSTDGAPGIRHPRSTGTYARLISYYVNELGALSLESAIHKASGLPASIMKLEDRGVIRAGAKADLIMFYPDQVKPTSDYVSPFSLAKGFDLVMVNGAIAWQDGDIQPGRHGVVVTR